jgi:hypothetical protein
MKMFLDDELLKARVFGPVKWRRSKAAREGSDGSKCAAELCMSCTISEIIGAQRGQNAEEANFADS